MSIFVGLDCGGSSSRLMAVDLAGDVLHQGQSGAANLATTPENRVRKNLEHASSGCPSPDFVCGCFAGVVNDQIRNKGIRLLREIFPEANLRAEPDFVAAFYAAPPGTDLCVIAGTGSLVCSQSSEGLVKSGGKGFILGDEGSTFHYGKDLVAEYLRNPQKASTNVLVAIQEYFGTTESGEIVAAVYRSATPASALGKFAKVLAMEAQLGNLYAVESIDRHSHELAAVVVRHVDKYLPDKPELQICLTGGLWKSHSLFREVFFAKLSSMLPGRALHVFRNTRPPLYGAVRLAKEMSIVD